MKFQVTLSRPTVMTIEAASPQEAVESAIGGREGWVVLEVSREPVVGDRVNVRSDDGGVYAGEVVGVVKIYGVEMADRVAFQPNPEDPIPSCAPLPPHAEVFEDISPKFRLEDGRVVYGCQVRWCYSDEMCEDCEDCPACRTDSASN